MAKEKGILATPNLKLSGRTLTQRAVEHVKERYRSDEVSCVIPGMKDSVSAKMEEKRIQVQKCLILCYLREAYKSFKTKHTEVRVGLSKFADLHPKECVLAGASGTHAVCLYCASECQVDVDRCQAMTLEDIPVKSYKHSLAQMSSNNSLPECYMGECEQCPQRSTFKEQLNALMEREMVDEVQYKQWVSTDRSTLETMVKKTMTCVTN